MQAYYQINIVRPRVAEPKLFDSAPAPAPTFKRFRLRLWLRSRLRLRLELCGCLFSQLLNEKVDFSWLFRKKIDLIQFFDPIQYELWLNTLLKFALELEPEPKLQYTGSSSGSGQKFRLRPAPAPQPWFVQTELSYSFTFLQWKKSEQFLLTSWSLDQVPPALLVS
jgi:hypothetical protein